MTPVGVTRAHGSVAFVCPQCKGTLTELECRSCGTTYPAHDGIPNFLPPTAEFEKASSISTIYDQIYTDHARVWEDQGREAAFRTFFSKLGEGLSTPRLLEIGCGEGILLEALAASEKYAIDISPLALVKARSRTGASCAAAMAELLPFPDQSFDVVVSVGVMEHFIDEDKAIREIRRVLKPGGHHLALIHVVMTFAQRLKQKIREYLFPRFRPIQLVKWIRKKSVNPIHQPIQHHYTIASARELFERNGLAVQRTITLRTDPSAPLAGEHVVIYIAN